MTKRVCVCEGVCVQGPLLEHKGAQCWARSERESHSSRAQNTNPVVTVTLSTQSFNQPTTQCYTQRGHMQFCFINLSREKITTTLLHTKRLVFVISEDVYIFHVFWQRLGLVKHLYVPLPAQCENKSLPRSRAAEDAHVHMQTDTNIFLSALITRLYSMRREATLSVCGREREREKELGFGWNSRDQITLSLSKTKLSFSLSLTLLLFISLSFFFCKCSFCLSLHRYTHKTKSTRIQNSLLWQMQNLHACTTAFIIVGPDFI